MAMFGFVYAWYLMVVLLLEIWFDYRKDFIKWAGEARFPSTSSTARSRLFTTDVSEAALASTRKAVHVITIIGIPSAFLLHGTWGSSSGRSRRTRVEQRAHPIVFLFSAIVSGIAMVLLLT